MHMYAMMDYISITNLNNVTNVTDFLYYVLEWIFNKFNQILIKGGQVNSI